MNLTNLNSIFLFLAVIFLSLISIKQCTELNKEKELLEEYKNIIIANDSIREISAGQYQKLVDNTLTEKQLKELVSKQNEELYKRIVKANEKIISNISSEISFDDKTDTIYLTQETREQHFTDYYPNKESSFISYSGIINQNTIIGSFKFKTFPLNITITEKTSGIFEANLDAPKWVKLNKLSVNTLPIEKMNQDNFDWMFGGGVGYQFDTDKPVLGIEGGFRLKQSLYSIQVNTENQALFSIKKLF